MKYKHFILLLAVIAILISSCKYDEGPLISIYSKDNRLTNTWIPDEATINGGPGIIESNGAKYVGSSTIDPPYLKEVTMLDNGQALAIYQVNSGQDQACSGFFTFNGAKEGVSVQLDVDGEVVFMAWNITHLGKNKLKVNYVWASNLYEVTFRSR
ncbi:MAG: hypothetical protein U0176_03420 [Bacteroidia bacterium]